MPVSPALPDCGGHLLVARPRARTRRWGHGPPGGLPFRLGRRHTIARRSWEIGMKVFLSSDIEGTAGIVDWQQVLGPGTEYEMGRRLLLAEVNAAIDGA